MEKFSQNNFLENYYLVVKEEIIIKYISNSFSKLVENKITENEKKKVNKQLNNNLTKDEEIKKEFINKEIPKKKLNEKTLELKNILKDIKSIKNINYTKNSLGCFKLKELLKIRENLKNKNIKKLESFLNLKKKFDLTINDIKYFKYFFTFRRMKNLFFKYGKFDLLKNEINFLTNEKKNFLEIFKKVILFGITKKKQIAYRIKLNNFEIINENNNDNLNKEININFDSSFDKEVNKKLVHNFDMKNKVIQELKKLVRLLMYFHMNFVLPYL